MYKIRQGLNSVCLCVSVSSNTQFCSFIDLSDSYRFSYFWDDDDEDGGGGVGEDDDSDGDVKLNISWVKWPTTVTYVQEVFNTGPSWTEHFR
jgi:hypothetical protein